VSQVCSLGLVESLWRIWSLHMRNGVGVCVGVQKLGFLGPGLMGRVWPLQYNHALPPYVLPCWLWLLRCWLPISRRSILKTSRYFL